MLSEVCPNCYGMDLVRSRGRGFWERWILYLFGIALVRCADCNRLRGTTGEQIISWIPCPICDGSGKRGDEVCTNCDGDGSIPIYEENPDYLP
jgi:hypothetical protein